MFCEPKIREVSSPRVYLRLSFTTYYSEWFKSATPSFLTSLSSSLPSRAHTYTHKCTTRIRQKSNRSIGDRRNPRETSNTHLKTSISSRLSSLLSFCLSSRFSIPIIGVLEFHFGVTPDLYSADCAHLLHYLRLWSSMFRCF